MAVQTAKRLLQITYNQEVYVYVDLLFIINKKKLKTEITFGQFLSFISRDMIFFLVALLSSFGKLN